MALFMIHKGSVGVGEILLVLGVLAQFAQTMNLNPSTLRSTTSVRPTEPVRVSKAHKTTAVKISSRYMVSWIPDGFFRAPVLWLALLVSAWVVFYLDLLAFPSHCWMFPALKALPFGYSYWGLVASWVFMVVAFMRMPQFDSAPDLSPRTSRWLFLLIMALGLFMVSYRPFWPIGVMTEDNIVHTTTSRLVNQLGDWRVFWGAGIGTNWPPFNSMFACFLWLFNSDMTGLTVQKIANTLYEVAFIFTVYLAGKEAVNRRAGLFAAALCAVSHPVITKSVGGLLGNSNAVTVMLPVWLLFRAMNRPKMTNFLWWGAAVALSIYTYVVNRPFMFVAVVGALAWILIQQTEERKMDRPAFWLTLATLGTFVLYFYYTSNLYATDNFFSRALDTTVYLMPCLLLGALWIIGLFFWPKVFQSGTYPYLSGWIAAAWLAIILSFPRTCDPYEQGVLANSGAPGCTSFKPIQDLLILFDSNSTDYYNHHVVGDSFFGSIEFALGVVGLALVVVRPTLFRLFLTGVFGLFCVIWLFGGSYHTQRLQPCAGPLILLAGLAVEQIWSWLCALTRSRLARVLFIGTFSGLVVWTAHAEFDQVHLQWVDHFLDVDVSVWRRTVLDMSQGNHVYFGPDVVFGRGAYFLHENHPVEFLQNNNLITLDANEKLKDVVVFLRKYEPAHNVDDQFETKIRSLFPDAKWEDIRCPWDSGEGLLALRCVIPAADLLKPQDLFTVQTVPSPCWTRSYFFIENALRPGVLDWKTRIAQADAPPPNGAQTKSPELVRYEGNLTVNQTGDYELVCKASSLTVVEVDGKRVIGMIFPYTQNFSYRGPGETKIKSIHLSRGIHTLQVTTNMSSTNALADIQWRHPGEKGPGTSIWTSFTL
jgi:hypothetical protein